LVNKALWSEKTTLEFYSEGAEGGRLGNEIKEIKNIVKVETILLSEYLQKQVDFLKIDIEGAEYNVLEECQNYLKNVKNIFVEYHSFSNKIQVLERILTILKNSVFKFYNTLFGK
jgi:FkbM family methyltransferase